MYLTHLHPRLLHLAPLVSGGAEPAAMRLLAKGKEAADDATVAALGMAPAGGRLMLLFKRRHHAEREGEALVQAREPRSF